ncbi:MAG: TRAP transporter fused permease subunit [Candidatus Methanomethylicia archaeon]
MRNIERYFVTVLALGMALWSLYYVVSVIETYTFRMVHLAFILSLTPLLYPISKRGSWKLRVFDYIFSVLGFIVIIYVFTDFEGFIYRSTMPTDLDILFGAITIILILEMMRRTAGIVLPLLVVFFLAYTYFGPYLPPPFTHRGYGIDRIVGHMYMTLEGIFGVPLDVSASFVTIFVVYGALMEAAGAGRFFTNLALKFMGRKPSSAGRAVVLTTGLVGGPQGSGVATTMSLGPVLWPLLRDAGYSPHSAAGLLATGGIGAVISPPIMGAAAFLMMEFLRISYLEVILLCMMPTILYYIAFWLIIELEARKLNLKPVTVTLPTWRSLLKDSYHLLSLIILIVLIVIAGRTPQLAAFWAIITVIVTSFLNRNRKEKLTPRNLLNAISEGMKSLITVATVLAGAGLIIGSFTLTGLGLKLAGIIMTASMGFRILALILAAIATVIIGLAIPITASYVITVIIVAPALKAFGIPEYITHTFVFYYAVLSEVSPPVGLSPLAASSITGAKPFSAMMQAWKYSLPAFLVPFLFSVTDEGASLLLIKSPPIDFIEASIVSIIAMLLFAAATIGYIYGKLTIPERIILLIGSLGIAFFPYTSIIFIISIIIVTATIIIHIAGRKIRIIP